MFHLKNSPNWYNLQDLKLLNPQYPILTRIRAQPMQVIVKNASLGGINIFHNTKLQTISKLSN